MTDKPNITPEGYVAQLTRLGRWSSPEDPIPYAFMEERPTYGDSLPVFEPFSAFQRAATERAFALIAEVANLSFVEVVDNRQEPGPGNPRITFQAGRVDALFSGSTLPYQLEGSSDIHGADIVLNNLHLQRRIANEGLYEFNFYVILHEILHALGLSHPGDYNGAGFNYQDDAQFAEDTRQYSVMSYWAAAELGADHFIGTTQYVASTPLLYDILALQSLYGANLTTRTGDTVYGFNSNTGNSPFNFVQNPGPVIAIWDAGGRDSINLSGYSQPSLINLTAGAFSDAGGLTKNIAIAFGVTIENAVGGPGNDTLLGNAVANVLIGGGGADFLDGDEGGDTMTGGIGNDSYRVDSTSDVVVENAGEGIDVVGTTLASYSLQGTHIENLTGRGFVDQLLTGNDFANVLNGGAGADVMRGGGRNDTYFVDNAGDQAVETSANGGTDTVHSAIGFTLGTNLENLVLTGTAAIDGIGNGLANDITGNAAANALNGGAGADILRGAAGNDVLDGGTGIDTLIGGLGGDAYRVETGDVVEESVGGGTDTVFARASFTLASGADVETLRTNSALGTENLVLAGSDFGNRILGNEGANALVGKGGADTLRGNGGSDRLFGGNAGDALFGGNGNDLVSGGAGSDRLDGGAGQDNFRFDAALGVSNIDQILGYSVADDRILLDDAVFAGLAPGALPAGAFRTGSTAADADDRIVYDSATGALYFDADGNGAGARVQFAQLDPGLALTAGEFTVI